MVEKFNSFIIKSFIINSFIKIRIRHGLVINRCDASRKRYFVGCCRSVKVDEVALIVSLTWRHRIKSEGNVFASDSSKALFSCRNSMLYWLHLVLLQEK